MQFAAVGAQHLARQAQGKGLLTLGELQHPVAEQRQARFGVAANSQEVQPQVAPGQRGEILDQQALATRIGLPVQAPLGVAGLIGFQPLVIIGTLPAGARTFVFLVLTGTGVPGAAPTKPGLEASLPGVFAIGDVRGGHGLMLAIEMVGDRATKSAPDKAVPALVQKVAYEAGAMVRVSGPNIILSPPLVLTEADAAVILTALDKGFSAV